MASQVWISLRRRLGLPRAGLNFSGGLPRLDPGLSCLGAAPEAVGLVAGFAISWDRIGSTRAGQPSERHSRFAVVR